MKKVGGGGRRGREASVNKTSYEAPTLSSVKYKNTNTQGRGFYRADIIQDIKLFASYYDESFQNFQISVSLRAIKCTVFKILFYRNDIVSFERERERERKRRGGGDVNCKYKLSGSGQTKTGLEKIYELKASH